MTKVYLDMDGVLADFDRGLREGYGIENCHINYQTPNDQKTPEQWDLVYKIRKCMSTPGFFSSLPMMEGALGLWNVVSTPYVLTAVPGQGADEMVAKEKREWIIKHFGELPQDRVITCLRPEKAAYAESFDPTWYKGVSKPVSNILVDDIEANVEQWKEAGGIGILFVTMEQAIRDLEKVLQFG